MIKLMQDGKEHYFDKNGIEIVKGTDATNPAWVESGKAAPCEYGIYPLENSDCEVVEVVAR